MTDEYVRSGHDHLYAPSDGNPRLNPLLVTASVAGTRLVVLLLRQIVRPSVDVSPEQGDQCLPHVVSLPLKEWEAGFVLNEDRAIPQDRQSCRANASVQCLSSDLCRLCQRRKPQHLCLASWNGVESNHRLRVIATHANCSAYNPSRQTDAWRSDLRVLLFQLSYRPVFNCLPPITHRPRRTESYPTLCASRVPL